MPSRTPMTRTLIDLFYYVQIRNKSSTHMNMKPEQRSLKRSVSEQRRIIELIVSHERPQTATSRLRACNQVIVSSGVTRGLSQGGQNLTEWGPMSHRLGMQ